MSTAEFRATLDRLGLTQVALARVLIHLGDQGQPISILRRVQRWAAEVSAVPGETVVLLELV